MMNDFRFALRSILKSPAFSILAIITLASGIGMNTVMNCGAARVDPMITLRAE
jgi:hypothetical protein